MQHLKVVQWESVKEIFVTMLKHNQIPSRTNPQVQNFFLQVMKFCSIRSFLHNLIDTSFMYCLARGANKFHVCIMLMKLIFNEVKFSCSDQTTITSCFQNL
jgi:hypothetical protein